MLQSIPYGTSWTYLSTSESTLCTGKNTSQYKNVNTNRSKITGALRSNRPVSRTLKQKFKEERWLEPTDDPADDELVTLVLNRIEHDVSQFIDFIDMLKAIDGADLIVRTLTGMDTSSFLNQE